MNSLLDRQLTILDRLEKLVFADLEVKAVDTALWVHYMAFSKRAFHFYYHFDQPTSDNEATVLVSEFVSRGLVQSVLDQLKAIAKTTAEQARA